MAARAALDYMLLLRSGAYTDRSKPFFLLPELVDLQLQCGNFDGGCRE